MSFSIGLPFVANDIEFVSLIVEGQSFMLHQIRKMIGKMIKKLLPLKVFVNAQD